MKNYKKFLEEVSIKGNPAIPGGGEEKDWVKGVDVEKAGQKVDPSQIGQKVGRLMDLLRQSMRFTNGKEKELAKLAEEIINQEYGKMIKRYNVEFEIELVRQGDAKKQIEKKKYDKEKPEGPQRLKEEEIEEVDTQQEIHKRKVANLMSQGYAKNTKHILHAEITKEGLKQIYGNRWEEIFRIWDEMTKIADTLDWSIPVEQSQKMIRMAPDSAAGACRVEWKPEEPGESQEEQEEEDSESEYGLETPEDKKGMKPVIRAVGIDFPMLLHEATKGFFEFLSIIGLPEDEGVVKDILANTGTMDEPEDWKYGPEVAKHFRDFVNMNPKCNKYANVIEEVWYYMLDRKNLNTEDFLKLVRGILSKTNEARVKVDKIIDAVADYIGQWEEYDRQMERYKLEMEEYEKKMAEWNKRESEPHAQEEEDEISKLMSEPSDYSKMSKSQLNDLLNAALDDGDYATADLIIKEIDKK